MQYNSQPQAANDSLKDIRLDHHHGGALNPANTANVKRLHNYTRKKGVEPKPQYYDCLR